MPFSETALFRALSNDWIDEGGVAAVTQARYLVGYLRHFDTRTIVVENKYIDRDDLEDYASYYVGNFQPYHRFTKRLHFFAEDFTDSSLTLIFAAKDKPGVERLQRSYIGFVVARPLPTAIVGRTILRTYEEQGVNGATRAYPTRREYSPYLFGIPLQVESLAYQQQDKAVAACATVALWSAFHKTQRLFDSARPTPAAITRSANLVRGTGRSMPSRSLTSEQMAECLALPDLNRNE